MQATLEDIQQHLAKIPAEEKVDEAVYRQRLDSCKQCEYLVSGTCLKCGCYVELRAAFVGQKCPNVKKRAW